MDNNIDNFRCFQHNSTKNPSTNKNSTVNKWPALTGDH